MYPLCIHMSASASTLLAQRSKHLVWLLRFCDSAEVAHRSVRKLIDAWQSQDALLITAFYTSAVIHYARIFCSTRKGQTYKENRIRREAGFDLELHKMLLAVRGQLSAHTDQESATGSFTLVGRTVSAGTLSVTATSELLVHAVGLAGPKDCAMAERIERHMLVVAMHLERTIREAAMELGNAVAGNAEILAGALAEEGGKRVDHPREELELDANRAIDFPAVPISAPEVPDKEVRPGISSL